MGPRAVRITNQDFLIPPEYRGYRLAERSTAQIGGVSLGLANRDGRTLLEHTFQQVPLRVLPPFQFSGEPAALLYLLNPTTGLLNGDGHLIEIEAGPGACAVITGQSANRVHPALDSFSTQQWRVKVRSGARLVILPGPTIPYRGCRYFQAVRIELEGDARLIWGDIWTPGRYDRGESSEFYQFAQIVQDFTVHRDGDLIYRDRFRWDGPWDAPAASWHVGDGRDAAAGSLFVTGDVPDPEDREGPLRHRSRLALDRGDSLLRWCGPSASIVPDIVGAALGLAARWTPDGPARRWLIDGHHLNPSHWFSVQ